MPSRLFFSPRLTLFICLIATLAGCQLFRPYGSKQQLEPASASPHKKVDDTVRTMRFEIITDAESQVVTITVRKSSGLDAIDAYVADSIRGDLKLPPSTRSLVELNYSAAREHRFSDPKILSSSPLS